LLSHLNSELAGGLKNDGLDHFVITFLHLTIDQLFERQQESQGFAGAGTRPISELALSEFPYLTTSSLPSTKSL
jgi:hypothetical protein